MQRNSGSGDKRDEGGEPAETGGLEPLFAALDLGTNNCRLLVARVEGDGFVVVDAFSRAVRLGEGVERSNALGPAAQDRALKALRICASKMRQHRVAAARIVATEACRRASNGSSFVRRVVREVGLHMEIISAEEEARLAIAGCAPLIDPEVEHLLVFDIGGGSTELIWVDMSRTPSSRRISLIRALAPTGGRGAESDSARAAAAHITDWISVPTGVSTLHDRFASEGDPRARFAAMSAHFAERLAAFIPFRAPDRAELTRRLQIIGVSGTATTFGAIHLGLQSYDRGRVDGLWMSSASAAQVAERLLTADLERIVPRAVGPGRSELLLAGAAILMTILQCWPVDRFRIADRGLREGMLYGLLHQRRIAAQ